LSDAKVYEPQTRALLGTAAHFRLNSHRKTTGDVRREREFFIDNLLVRLHLIMVMIRWTGLAPLEFEFPFPGSLTSTFLGDVRILRGGAGGLGRNGRSSLRAQHRFSGVPKTWKEEEETRNPEPETRGPKPHDPKPGTGLPGTTLPETRNPEPGTRNPEPETRNHLTQDRKPETRNYLTRTPEPETMETLHETTSPPRTTIGPWA